MLSFREMPPLCLERHPPLQRGGSEITEKASLQDIVDAIERSNDHIALLNRMRVLFPVWKTKWFIRNRFYSFMRYTLYECKRDLIDSEAEFLEGIPMMLRDEVDPRNVGELLLCCWALATEYSEFLETRRHVYRAISTTVLELLPLKIQRTPLRHITINENEVLQIIARVLASDGLHEYIVDNLIACADLPTSFGSSPSSQAIHVINYITRERPLVAEDYIIGLIKLLKENTMTGGDVAGTMACIEKLLPKTIGAHMPALILNELLPIIDRLTRQSADFLPAQNLACQSILVGVASNGCVNVRKLLLDAVLDKLLHLVVESKIPLARREIISEILERCAFHLFEAARCVMLDDDVSKKVEDVRKSKDVPHPLVHTIERLWLWISRLTHEEVDPCLEFCETHPEVAVEWLKVEQCVSYKIIEQLPVQSRLESVQILMEKHDLCCDAGVLKILQDMTPESLEQWSWRMRLMTQHQAPLDKDTILSTSGMKKQDIYDLAVAHPEIVVPGDIERLLVGGPCVMDEEDVSDLRWLITIPRPPDLAFKNEDLDRAMNVIWGGDWCVLDGLMKRATHLVISPTYEIAGSISDGEYEALVNTLLWCSDIVKDASKMRIFAQKWIPILSSRTSKAPVNKYIITLQAICLGFLSTDHVLCEYSETLVQLMSSGFDTLLSGGMERGFTLGVQMANQSFAYTRAYDYNASPAFIPHTASGRLAVDMEAEKRFKILRGGSAVMEHQSTVLRVVCDFLKVSTTEAYLIPCVELLYQLDGADVFTKENALIVQATVQQLLNSPSRMVRKLAGQVNCKWSFL